jgi:hypothetical protein
MKRRRTLNEDWILLSIMAQGYLDARKYCHCKDPDEGGKLCIYHRAEKAIQRVYPDFQWKGYEVLEYPAPTEVPAEVQP